MKKCDIDLPQNNYAISNVTAIVILKVILLRKEAFERSSFMHIMCQEPDVH